MSALPDQAKARSEGDFDPKEHAKIETKHHERATDKLLKKLKVSPKDFNAFKKELDREKMQKVVEELVPSDSKVDKKQTGAVREALADFIAAKAMETWLKSVTKP